MKKILATVLATASLAVYAGDNWTNSNGDPWRNSTGLCWRNSAWTPATAHPDCDGALKPAARVQVVIPAPKIEAPVAPKPNLVKLTFSTDTLFDFDKSIIKREGRQMLDGLIGLINNDYNEEYIIIAVGHTDWVGSDAYNIKLGQRRAEAVKAYLVSKGIDAKRVHTDSKGESQPVADNRTAAGRAKNRRVEIDVTGTKRKN